MFGAEGEDRARRLDAQGVGQHRRTVWGELLQIDGQRAACGADACVRAFNERWLEGDHGFILVDPLFIKSREDERVVQRAALVAG